MSKYNPAQIEPKWQRYWEENETFKSVENDQPKYYVLDMFPYPSGSGLHVGHVEGYTATDIVSRFKRMRGFNVLHPMGWDSFGLPAEQYAIQTGTNPRDITVKNVDTFRKQLKSLGFSYDWSREISTSTAKYYHWTQWIFLQLYKKGLAYVAEMPVNWCPALGTVLANEEVIDGKSERGGHPVIRKPMRQWILRITAYAERLYEDLELLDWPEGIKEMQRNWIGRSEGAEVKFKIADTDRDFMIFTTRPDTLFGATYCVLAPEHALVQDITTPDQKAAVEAYIAQAARKSDMERTELAKEKTGVFTGAYAINPVNNERIPIWIADYVLSTYGFGAIMAVPGHDQRDWDFAKEYNIPILEVIKGGDITAEAYTGDGVLVNSGFLDGLSVPDAKKRMNDWLEEKGIGARKINYRLRDWLFSRQRYWGEPIPILHLEDGTMRPLDENELPLLLPEVDSITPSGTGESPLATVEDWVNVIDPVTGQKARRETNTMPQWAGSCWYYLRYLDPDNDQAFCDPGKQKYWLPVDLYVGGAEHAVLHLLYARFWHKVLFDLGYVSTKEPFQKLFNQGMILGENGEKMSKSRGNVVNPDDIIQRYGADTLRLYEMFMGPLEAMKPWNSAAIEGSFRFLARTWRLFVNEEGALNQAIGKKDVPESLVRSLHRTIKKVTQDLDGLRFNTAISQLMIFLNDAMKADALSREMMDAFAKMLSPFAPHIAEELWELLGHKKTLAYEPWPTYDEALTVEPEIEMVVQLNGKIQSRIQVPAESAQEDVLAKAKDVLGDRLTGKTIVKEIVVPGRLVNIVCR